MKFSYLCIVGRKIETGAPASQNFVSGLRDFTACPERKKSIRKSTESVSQQQTINFRFFITFLLTYLSIFDLRGDLKYDDESESN
jgi:hypothetical protein